MMAVGEIQESGGKCVIRAMKIQDLSKDTVAQKLWHLEIMDLDKHVYS